MPNPVARVGGVGVGGVLLPRHAPFFGIAPDVGMRHLCKRAKNAPWKVDGGKSRQPLGAAASCQMQKHGFGNVTCMVRRHNKGLPTRLGTPLCTKALGLGVAPLACRILEVSAGEGGGACNAHVHTPCETGLHYGFFIVWVCERAGAMVAVQGEKRGCAPRRSCR